MAILSFTSCNKKALPTQPAIEKEVEIPAEFQFQLNAGDFLDAWHKAAAEANFGNYFNAFSQRGVFVGTDKTEVWSKEEFAEFSKPYFDKGKAWTFKPIERSMHVGDNGKYVWFDETLDTWMGVCRGSGVMSFDQSKNEFKLEHYVLSLTVPNEKMREVMKVIEAQEKQKEN